MFRRRACGVARYAYVGNNPLTYSDAYGLCRDRDRQGECRVRLDRRSLFGRSAAGASARAAAERAVREVDHAIQDLSEKGWALVERYITSSNFPHEAFERTEYGSPTGN